MSGKVAKEGVIVNVNIEYNNNTELLAMATLEQEKEN